MIKKSLKIYLLKQILKILKLKRMDFKHLEMQNNCMKQKFVPILKIKLLQMFGKYKIQILSFSIVDICQL